MTTTEEKALRIYGMNAVILDLDGVLTNTATLHMKAWKEIFNDFFAQIEGQNKMTDEDYYLYLDGLPRYDGVKKMLESRGIQLEYGSPEDEEGKRTICGLGNRKNKLYLDFIDQEGVEVFPNVYEQLKHWKSHGLKLAVVSSSKNCKQILQAAGLLNDIDVVVDGVTSEEENLKGKPNPDIFLNAAKKLDTTPEQTVVFEDAVSGVQAGKRGNFAFVIGVSYHGKRQALLKNGADVVISDFEQLNMYDNPEIGPYFEQNIPSVFKENLNFSLIISNKTPVFFFDYDGTLTPIVSKPEDALLDDGMRKIIQELNLYCRVAIVSGRDHDDVKNLVDLDNLIYAGSHGYHISGADGMRMELPEAEEKLPLLNEMENELRQLLEKKIRGVKIDRKRYAIAIHYRNTPVDRVEEVKKITADYLKEKKGFKAGKGKKIIEIKPDIDWHKGKAVNWILEKLNLQEKDKYLPVYLGDDITDEDAFREIADHGIGILVGFHEAPSAAHYSLRDTEQVKKFLELIVKKYRNNQ